MNDAGVGAGGKDSIGGGAIKDTIYGGEQADIPTGGVGNDAVYGGTGNDTITGGVGRDHLAGGIGKDVFGFNTTIGSSKSLAPKFIDTTGLFKWISTVDSVACRDRTDLSDIDAQAATDGKGAFSYTGADAFSAEGQIRFTQTDRSTLIEVNTTGTDDAEMRIFINGLDGSLLEAADFIL